MYQPEAADSHELRTTRRPDFEVGDRVFRFADVFAGCGGLSLGVAQAANDHGWATDVALAVDIEPAMTAVYKTNFPKAVVETISVDSIFDGSLSAGLTTAENKIIGRIGKVDAVVGGPPCQGHSDLNNHTRRTDLKNLLYLRMARAAEVLQPSIVLIENVPAVQNDKRRLVHNVRQCLTDAGYQVADAVLKLDTMGVPQRRRRHLLLACRSPWPSPHEVLSSFSRASSVARDLNWAIGDLAMLADRSGLDYRPRASEANLARMEWLLRNDEYDLPNSLRPECHRNEHSYKSMYGRLKWHEPAQTITSGFGSIGQGRYMHPGQPRALTAHEAARIQSFPDYFDFSAAMHRSALATMIGNAVPPLLGRMLFCALFDRFDSDKVGQLELDI
ncbi:MAG: DNA cytosine methyltransferase [Streptosporangiaceae bacterium]